MGGCQNYGPFLATLNIRCRILIGIQKGTIILTTTHMGIMKITEANAHTVTIPIPTAASGVRKADESWGSIGIVEKKMETTIMGSIGVI